MLYLYFAVTLATLVALSGMILAIARAFADCPEKGRRARAAGVTIATGYLAIGGGAVLLIAALAALRTEPDLMLFCMGLAVVILGLGFTQAVTTLRAVVDPAPKPELPMPPIAATAAI